MVGDDSASPPSFTYTSGYDVLKVVRIDTKIGGEKVEAECQALNANYHELSMDNQLQYNVSTDCAVWRAGYRVKRPGTIAKRIEGLFF